MSDQANNITSALINSQVPEFVRNEHQTFVKFIEYYYKALERDGQQLYVDKNFLRFLDVDGINQDVKEDALKGDQHAIREEGDYHAFLQKLYDNFIGLIPDEILADKVLILKHAREFYRSRGSEKSVRFLMRALYNKEVTFYYPKQDILRASDGKWFIEKSLKIKDISVNNVSNTIASTNFTNKTIQGATSNATALVERVDSYYDKGALVYELKLSGIYKEFINAEKVFCFFTEEGVTKYLSANLFSGVITAVRISEGGSGYTEGATVPITSNGSGAQIVISKVTKGSIQAISASFGGAGFRVDDPVVISAASGSGANANVSGVNKSGYYHPNSYNVVWSTIALEASTNIGNLIYSNLNSKIIDPANDTGGITNSMGYFAYSNCGPAQTFFVITGGNNYIPPLSLTISANSFISKLGILGRMDIIDGGSGYQANDKIEFINKLGDTGSGAFANVAAVDANGTITEVHFIQQPGQIIGGSGYNANNLPIANVMSATGNGANIMVTASIGHNERLVSSNSVIGKIEELTIVSGGSGYVDNPILRLDLQGDGTANAQLTVVTGAYSYPGRYINDDGQLSSYNFLEDRDYYQNFSYVVKIDETINKYRKPIKDLIHPAGTKLFGEYTITDDQVTASNTNVVVTYSNTESNTIFYTTDYRVEGYVTGTFAPNVIESNVSPEILEATYTLSTANQTGTFNASNNDIRVFSISHGYSANDYAYAQFTSNGWANLVNSSYVVTFANTNYLTLRNPNTESSTGNTGNIHIYNPKITVSVTHSTPSVSDNVHLNFETKDPLLKDGIYTVIGAATNTFYVLHPSANSANDSANTVNVRTHKLLVSSNNHGFSTGNLAYLIFTSGDQANVPNTYYTVTSVKDANTFNIVSQNLVMSRSNANVHIKKSDVVITSHAASNGNTVYISFVSGDQANTVNGVYIPVKVGANKFTVNVAKPVTSNSSVRVYYSTNSYSNIVFSRTSHGFIANDNVWIEFFTSTSDLANGVYKINTVYDSNTYNIYYNSNSYINTTSNTIVYSGLGVKTDSSMEGTASVGLYK